jgi:hypothetical protein
MNGGLRLRLLADFLQQSRDDSTGVGCLWHVCEV